MKSGTLMTVGEAAKALGVGPGRIRSLDQTGELQSIRTAGGQGGAGTRLFHAEEVERLRKAREQKKGK